ncbi:GPO family capsid scaffolding protein [Kiloniella laminariae]|uniref:GPO family capsid scaffolding protein n=1 Tax=Kiloniella laminariae TaxID=454162 RepID=A0ABT4LKW3_9PROT|nr:GPO family capsid scaffolding protein [Kiloniella laminariae]MCZ4281717.1 GPO family capsid scaffolding protein [Kiloniella laminariae]
MLKSKFFRVATSGKTVDGREISPEQINQMAANYNPQTYGARVWLEHYRSIMPDGPFKAYGDVIGLKAEDGPDGKRVLLAQIAPTADLIELNKRGQKVYSSIELNPKFSDTNQAYLMGLSVTDSPASIGTEMIKFCLENKEKFSKGSDLPDSILTDTIEVDDLDFADDSADDEEIKPTLLSKIKGMIGASEKTDKKAFAELQEAITLCASTISDLQKQNEDKAATVDITKLSARITSLSAEVDNLTKLSKQPAGDHLHRPASDGTGEHALTDC